MAMSIKKIEWAHVNVRAKLRRLNSGPCFITFVQAYEEGVRIANIVTRSLAAIGRRSMAIDIVAETDSASGPAPRRVQEREKSGQTMIQRIQPVIVKQSAVGALRLKMRWDANPG
jgi:hypothetical protein